MTAGTLAWVVAGLYVLFTVVAHVTGDARPLEERAPAALVVGGMFELSLVLLLILVI